MCAVPPRVPPLLYPLAPPLDIRAESHQGEEARCLGKGPTTLPTSPPMGEPTSPSCYHIHLQDSGGGGIWNLAAQRLAPHNKCYKHLNLLCGFNQYWYFCHSKTFLWENFPYRSQRDTSTAERFGTQHPAPTPDGSLPLTPALGDLSPFSGLHDYHADVYKPACEYAYTYK